MSYYMYSTEGFAGKNAYDTEELSELYVFVAVVADCTYYLQYNQLVAFG